jgi:secreted PhoX family phosphatase
MRSIECPEHGRPQDDQRAGGPEQRDAALAQSTGLAFARLADSAGRVGEDIGRLGRPVTNDSDNPCFEQVLAVLSAHGKARRRLLQFGIGSAALPFLGWPALAAPVARPGIGFRPVAASSDDAVRVPEGYTVQVLYAWGDPVSAGPAFRGDAGNSAAEQAEQAGMHHDGMHFFPFVRHGQPSSTHGLLCVNHEYTDEGLLHPDGHGRLGACQDAQVAECARRFGDRDRTCGAAAGTSRWRVVRPSAYARRITARTPMRIDGPAAGAGPPCAPVMTAAAMSFSARSPTARWV